MYKEKTETCGKRIEMALTIRKMKQADLCRLAHIPKSSLSLYLREAYEPKKDRLYEMAIVLNVSETWLMGYDVPMGRDSVTTDSMRLTDCERIMLDLFRQIPESQQKILIQMIRDGLGARR